ncbi:hypothetical protein Acr_05g0011710 [Actinidia rufa]|uniref:Uncharacterized protein n=1 Tax=Actinidia rufa TaxID=165716 RepID=A0A7J0EMJ9_9ERIC|nr:hypothetical protein Acr_05g0011710 [Actinidia rufa]
MSISESRRPSYPGPHGAETVILSIDEDIHIEEEIKKNEVVVGKGSHVKDHPQALAIASTSSDHSSHHPLDHI